MLRGKLQLRGLTVTLDQMREFLEPRAKEDPELTVVVQTSTKALQHELVDVLDACTELGLTKLNVATLKD